MSDDDYYDDDEIKEFGLENNISLRVLEEGKGKEQLLRAIQEKRRISVDSNSNATSPNLSVSSSSAMSNHSSPIKSTPNIRTMLPLNLHVKTKIASPFIVSSAFAKMKSHGR